jgi:hypothetical protein
MTDHRLYTHPETGEVFAPVEDLENCEAELRKARRRIKAYERREEDKRAAYSERNKVLAVIRYYAELTGHSNLNVNAADRFDMIVQRRKEQYPFGDPLEQAPETPCATICLAVEGLANFPYVGPHGRQSHNGRGSKRHDRLGIALGAGEDLERFARLGWKARMNGES